MTIVEREELPVITRAQPEPKTREWDETDNGVRAVFAPELARLMEEIQNDVRREEETDTARRIADANARRERATAGYD